MNTKEGRKVAAGERYIFLPDSLPTSQDVRQRGRQASRQLGSLPTNYQVVKHSTFSSLVSPTLNDNFVSNWIELNSIEVRRMENNKFKQIGVNEYVCMYSYNVYFYAVSGDK